MHIPAILPYTSHIPLLRIIKLPAVLGLELVLDLEMHLGKESEMQLEPALASYTTIHLSFIIGCWISGLNLRTDGSMNVCRYLHTYK